MQTSRIKNLIKTTAGKSALMENHQRNAEIDWIFVPNDGKHSTGKHSRALDGKCFCIRAISNRKRNALESRKHARCAAENSAFPRENSRGAAPLLRLNNRNNEENKKHTKTMGGASLAANRRRRMRREISCSTERLAMCDCTRGLVSVVFSSHR